MLATNHLGVLVDAAAPAQDLGVEVADVVDAPNTFAVFVWGLVIEQTVGGLYEATQRYLPYTAAASLAGAKLEAGTAALPFGTAAALVAAVAAGISLLAARTTLNADVT